MNSDIDDAARGSEGIARRMLDLFTASFEFRGILLFIAIAFTASVGTGLFVPNWNWSALEAIGTTAAVAVALWTSSASKRAEAIRVSSSRALAVIIHEPLESSLRDLVAALDPDTQIAGPSITDHCQIVMDTIDDISLQLSWIQDDLRHMDRKTVLNVIQLRRLVRLVRVQVSNLSEFYRISTIPDMDEVDRQFHTLITLHVRIAKQLIRLRS